MENVKINSRTIQLDQFLKWANLVESGGQAKSLIQAGKVRVNGEVEKRRSHKLSDSDIVELVDNKTAYQVSSD